MAQIPKDDPRYKLLHPYTMGKKAVPAKDTADVKIDFKTSGKSDDGNPCVKWEHLEQPKNKKSDEMYPTEKCVEHQNDKN